MADEAAVEPEAVLQALGIRPEGRPEPVAGGADTTIWRVTLDGQPFALRLFRPGEERRCEREVAAMAAAGAAGIPAPAIRAEGAWQERPALLLSWLRGKPLATGLFGRPWRIWTLGRAFGRMQATIHRVEAPPLLAAEPERWIRWCGPEENRLQERLLALPPRRALLHLDYHPLNVMSEGRAISGVLDWANCAAGDPRADLARSYTILRLDPLDPRQMPPGIGLLRRLLSWSWWRGYQEIAGPVRGMALFYAWAAAVMARDLAPRAGRPGGWLQHHHLEAIRQWGRRWLA
jgi:aminoglycoside phosphotransferase (APT) family kinase protein